MIKKIAVFSVLFILMKTTPVFCNIRLNGIFHDWAGMPGGTDSIGDEVPWKDITGAQWFSDTDNDALYFRVNRLRDYEEVQLKHGKTKRFDRNWNFDVHIQADNNRYRARIFAHKKTNRVNVRLYDGRNRIIWSLTGFWSDGLSAEFRIPLTIIVGDLFDGFSLNFRVASGNDSFPDSGTIMISAIPTGPVYAALIALGTVIYIYKRDVLKKCG